MEQNLTQNTFILSKTLKLSQLPMSLTARPIFCNLKLPSGAVAQKSEPPAPPPSLIQVQKSNSDNVYTKIVLQPRLCTLRSYGSDPVAIIKNKNNNMGEGDDNEVSAFFATLSDYIESSKKSQDFEIISGRFAMIVFAATLAEETVTGNSLFSKMDMQFVGEAAGVSLAAVTCAAIFAWFSSARNKVGPMFTGSCNTFIDSLVDQIIDGLFFDTDLSDWSDDV